MACNIGKEENMEQFKGKVWVLGDDIDTDIIIPTEYLALKTIEEMKQFWMWFFQGAGAGGGKGPGNPVCDCKIICPYFFPQWN